SLQCVRDAEEGPEVEGSRVEQEKTLVSHGRSLSQALTAAHAAVRRRPVGSSLPRHRDRDHTTTQQLGRLPRGLPQRRASTRVGDLPTEVEQLLHETYEVARGQAGHQQDVVELVAL